MSTIVGCTYSFAENFNPLASFDDGSCTLPNSEEPGCGLIYDGNNDGAVGSSDLLGLLTEFGAECTPASAFTCGDPVSYQGYDYATVLIGEQCWFAENLRSIVFSDNTPLLYAQSTEDWNSAVIDSILLSVTMKTARELRTIWAHLQWHRLSRPASVNRLERGQRFISSD